MVVFTRSGMQSPLVLRRQAVWMAQYVEDKGAAVIELPSIPDTTRMFRIVLQFEDPVQSLSVCVRFKALPRFEQQANGMNYQTATEISEKCKVTTPLPSPCQLNSLVCKL